MEDIRLVELKPGDVIVVEHPQRLPAETRDKLTANFNKIWPNHRVVVLDGGYRLTVHRNVEE